jgi:predicted PurR-regulated permease PerM
MGSTMNLDRNQIFWLAALLIFVFLLWLLSDILLPFVGGIALAYIQAPIADRLERFGMNRTAATLLIVTVVMAAILLLTFLLIPLLSQQAVALMAAIPGLAARLQAMLADQAPPWLQQILGEDPKSAVPKLMAHAPDTTSQVMHSLWSGGKALVSFASLLVILPVVTFYLIYDWHPMIDTLDSWVPPRYRDTVHQFMREIDAAVAGFLRGQAGICAIAALFYMVALSLVGLDFALLIGLLNGVLTIIPYIGSVVGALLGVGMAIEQFWPQWIPIAIVCAIFAVGQFITAYVLGPKLVGDKVGLHPVWLLFAMVAFGYLFGFVGLLVAVPLAAAIAVLFRFWLVHYFESPLYRGHPSG